MLNELPSSGKRIDVLGEQWVFETQPPEVDADTRDRFLALEASDIPSPTQEPLGIVLDRVAMNRWIRDHQDSKAFSLLLARIYDGGEDGNAHRSLAAFGTDALSTLRSRAPRSDWYELIVTTEPGELQRVRDAVKNAGQLDLGEPLALQRYGFGKVALLDDLDAAIKARRQYLIEREKAFVERFGLAWR